MNLPLLIGISVALLGAYGLFFRLGVRAGMRRSGEALQEAVFRTNEASEVLENARGAMASLQHELDLERHKSAGYFATIEAVLKQSATWEKLYQDQAIGHGNAQALMMDAIGFLTNRLRTKYGDDVKIPALLQEVQSLYQQEHVDPVTTALRAPNREPFSSPSEGHPEPIPNQSRTLPEGLATQSAIAMAAAESASALLSAASAGINQAIVEKRAELAPIPHIDEVLYPRTVP